jgi:hypothetical protein
MPVVWEFVHGAADALGDNGVRPDGPVSELNLSFSEDRTGTGQYRTEWGPRETDEAADGSLPPVRI